jgi:predicted dehydrogenase
MKILIAGLGSIGQRHARNLRALLGDHVDLLAYRVRGLPHVITERMTLDRSASVEHRHGIRAFDDLDAALAERPTAVIVCNPSRFHVPTAIQAIHAGCHVLIEKPLSDSYQQVDELIACASRRGLVAAVGYQMRFHPALRRLQQLLAARSIGPILNVRAEWGEYLPDAHPYEDYRQSYAARADLGGGVILCYIHELDYLTWLFGPPQSVSATGGRSGALDLDVEDHATTRMVTDIDGRDVTIELSQSFAQRSPSRSCVVLGEAGEIAVDFMTPSLEVRSGDGAVVGRESFDGFERNDLFLDEMKNFLGAIDGGPVAVPVAEAAVSLRMALAAKQSLRTGEPVNLQ